MSLFDSILAANDRPKLVENVPEWGVDVSLCSMTTAQREYFEAKVVGGERKNVRASVVAKCLFDPASGTFPFDTDSGVRILSEKAAAVMDRLFDKCLELSGMKVPAKGSDAPESQSSGDSGRG